MDRVIPVAGSFATSTGKGLDPSFTKLEDLPNSDMEGLRIELHGGKYLKRSQKAIIDMQCDPERTGDEKENSFHKGGKDGKDEKRSGGGDKTEEKEQQDDGDDDDDGDDINSLRYVSYGAEEGDEGVDILRLDWRTKYACGSYQEGDDRESGDEDKSNHWGFFTWFIVM